MSLPDEFVKPTFLIETNYHETMKERSEEIKKILSRLNISEKEWEQLVKEITSLQKKPAREVNTGVKNLIEKTNLSEAKILETIRKIGPAKNSFCEADVEILLLKLLQDSKNKPAK